jgi:hypothetical protein
MKTKQEILTRAIELIYISRDVKESELEGTSTDASTVLDIVNDGNGSETSSVNVLIDMGLDRHGAADHENTWDDAELLVGIAQL